MDIILYFFRDKIAGTYYFIYAFICLMLMFSIIGYLYKQKYAKVEVKLNTSQPKKDEKVEPSKNENKVENSNQRVNIFQKKQEVKTPVQVNGASNIVQSQVVTNTTANANPVNQTQVTPSIPRTVVQPIPQNVNQQVNPTVQVTPNVINKTVQSVNNQATPQQPITQTQVVTPVQQPVNKTIEIK